MSGRLFSTTHSVESGARKKDTSTDKIARAVARPTKATPHASAMKRDISNKRTDSISKRSITKPQPSKTFGVARNSVKPPTRKQALVHQSSKLSASQGRLKNAQSAMSNHQLSLKIPGPGLVSSHISSATAHLTAEDMANQLGRSKFKNSIVSAGGTVGLQKRGTPERKHFNRFESQERAVQLAEENMNKIDELIA
jgi:hypothetical protein